MQDKEPDFLICRECDSPCYIFEWRQGEVIEAFCRVCGNEDRHDFTWEGDERQQDQGQSRDRR